jgi:amino acid transporter
MHREEHPKLGQALATAVCGNDILSSCLYVSGIAILFAGIYAPLVLLSIGFVLFLFKKVYTEVVEALPMNGGAYNCLLNSTSKNVAAVAGVMTFLSYIATAVISAKVGVEYLASGIERWSETLFAYSMTVPVLYGTIVVLFLFAILVISGVKDSARVALVIFALHIFTLTIFIGSSAFSFWQHGLGYLTANMLKTEALVLEHGGSIHMVYFAFSASLLGVSGFESSANFIEEQKKGVFRLTLRNMLIGVVVFNPLIALAVLQSMPYDAIVSSKDFLLANAANMLGGVWFHALISIDAFLVLCGAVLTSYIGVSGLLHRMSADSCIPQYFGKKNRNGAYPRIVLSFFILCSSILLITQGDLLSLAGVYTIAFLGVMSMFALGNLILKESRTDLKRTYRAPFLAVVIAFLATVFGMLGNIRIDPDNLRFFELYFIPCLLLVLMVIYQDYIFKFFLRITRDRAPYLHTYINLHFSDLTQGKFVVFIHRVSKLRTMLQYIDRNETGWNITLVTCDKEGEETAVQLKKLVPQLQEAGFFPHFTISVLHKDLPFGPRVIDQVARELDVRNNRVLIGAINESHRFEYENLGGVRIITE